MPGRYDQTFKLKALVTVARIYVRIIARTENLLPVMRLRVAGRRKAHPPNGPGLAHSLRIVHPGVRIAQHEKAAEIGVVRAGVGDAEVGVAAAVSRHARIILRRDSN